MTWGMLPHRKHYKKRKWAKVPWYARSSLCMLVFLSCMSFAQPCMPHFTATVLSEQLTTDPGSSPAARVGSLTKTRRN